VTEMMRLSKRSTRSDTIRSRALAVRNSQSNFNPEKGNYKAIIQHHYAQNQYSDNFISFRNQFTTSYLLKELI